VKQADVRNIFQKASMGVCTETVVVSPDAYTFNFFSYEDSRKQKRTLMALNQQRRDIQLEHSSD